MLNVIKANNKDNRRMSCLHCTYTLKILLQCFYHSFEHNNCLLIIGFVCVIHKIFETIISFHVKQPTTAKV